LCAILAEDLESSTEEAWKLLMRYPLAKGAMYWQCFCEYLTAVTLDEIRHLIITIPPRKGKSTLGSVV